MLTRSLILLGIPTRIIVDGDDIAEIASAAGDTDPNLKFRDGDILVIAESALATAEGRIIRLSDINPSEEAYWYANKYHMDPSLAEVVLSESDSIVGGIDGFLLCMKQGTLLPNAGADESNAPKGHVVLLPEDPDKSACSIRTHIFNTCQVQVSVIIADSRTHPMRYGCSAIAIGCSGMEAVCDERGRTDLFGRRLEVTRRAIADNVSSAAELLMGEADESVPMVIVRGLNVRTGDFVGIEQISPNECLFMGTIARNRLDTTRRTPP